MHYALKLESFMNECEAREAKKISICILRSIDHSLLPVFFFFLTTSAALTSNPTSSWIQFDLKTHNWSKWSNNQSYLKEFRLPNSAWRVQLRRSNEYWRTILATSISRTIDRVMLNAFKLKNMKIFQNNSIFFKFSIEIIYKSDVWYKKASLSFLY